MSASYIDPEGKQWRVNGLRRNFVRHFWDAVREDGVLVSLYETRILWEN